MTHGRGSEKGKPGKRAGEEGTQKISGGGRGEVILQCRCGGSGKIIPFGRGFVATCTVCRHVLYSGKTRPKPEKKE